MRVRTPGAPRRRDLPRRPQRVAAAGFGLATLGGAGFAVGYALNANTQWLGLSLAGAFAGLAIGFASWVALLPEGPFVEKRESMISPPEDRKALADDLAEADGGIVSAPLPRRMLTLALTVVGISILFPFRSLLGVGLKPGRAQWETNWAVGVPVVKEDGTFVRPDEVELGEALTVFPQDRKRGDNEAVLLLRVDPTELQLPPGRRGWTLNGIIAYSKICTHAGCPVGLFAQGAGELLCPCHQSVFDIYRGAQPRYGPAARSLPQLPIGTDDQGRLVARGPLSGPPGPGWWRKP